ncbi:hypothetical protein ALC57_15423 [Trachymyrmex cornetzi]|uniref:DUF4817 domain-containing protein n=1 Tax=Trachymyrmex cornetzi TaxID=471704 RepID=A0A151IX63_9HYME|nr:hypothetical protein ALC57_15423 [Trachymyrmex cornetzi]
MLRNFLESKLRELEHPDVWFQQDGATAHTARRTMDVLREMFPGRIDELKAAIRQKITGISPQITTRVMETFRNQLRMRIEKNGRHLDSVIFKT